jgi:glutamate dehydrogenase
MVRGWRKPSASRWRRPAGAGAEPAVTIESVGGTSGERHLRIAVINDDMPFLVDSISATITAQG